MPEAAELLRSGAAPGCPDEVVRRAVPEEQVEAWRLARERVRLGVRAEVGRQSEDSGKRARPDKKSERVFDKNTFTALFFSFHAQLLGQWATRRA